VSIRAGADRPSMSAPGSCRTQEALFHVKPRVVAVVNQKGGVGKTTTAINLGATLAAYERRTLLVDLDPQGNCTTGLGFEASADTVTSYQLLTGADDLEAAERATDFPHLSLVPATPDLAGAEVELVGMVGREFRLRDVLRRVTGRHYVLIDCPPSLGLLTVNALAAADTLLIPIQCEYYAMEGVSKLMTTVDEVRRFLNPELAIDGVVLTMYDDRTNLAQQVAEEVRSVFGELVFHSVVPRNVRLAEAPSFGRPIHAYDLRSKGAQAYLELGREFLARTEVVFG
jgi:chromosome partitioning protein